MISGKKGFTLIELLTSVAIASIIMILLLGLIQQSSSTYLNSDSAVTTTSGSRAFFHFFESELSARLPNSALMFEEVSQQSDKIAFIRAKSFDEQTSPTEGDLTTSLYYVAFTKDQNGAVSPKLLRHSLDATETQTLIESSPTPVIPTGVPTLDEPILYNVVDFQAKPKQYSITGQTETWMPGSPQPPAFLEVSISITDDAVAGRFKTESAWNQLRDTSGKDAKRLVRTYTRTIKLSR